MKLALDADDLEFGKPGLDYFIKLKEHFPRLKMTFFMVPLPAALINKTSTADEYRTWVSFIKDNADWIEVCPHGFAHAGEEMLWMSTKTGKQKLVDAAAANDLISAAEHTFKQLDLPYQKIWKSPHWSSSPATYQALWERGYTIAVDKNQPLPEGGPTYVYNWSIDGPIPTGLDLVKGHGHMYPPSANAINLCFRNVMEQLPTHADFVFVSQVL